jgi:hypothetical protein
MVPMTTFERTKQPLSVFEHAGRTAFAMQILKTANPYPKTDANGVAEPAALAWDRGYQSAADEAFQKERPARPERKPFERKPGRRFDKDRTAGRKPSRPANHPRFVNANDRVNNGK